MQRTSLAVVLALALTGPAAAQAPTPAPSVPPTAAAADPLSGTLKRQYDGIKQNITEAAEKVADADYGFKPTPDVRSFGQLVAHVAESQYGICAFARGEESPVKDLEQTSRTRAEIIKALKASNEYCDALYTGMTDTKAMELIKAGPREVPRAAVLISNIAHDNEHYGNIVTYLRLKGIVPPSTERAQQQQRKGSGN